MCPHSCGYHLPNNYQAHFSFLWWLWVLVIKLQKHSNLCTDKHKYYTHEIKMTCHLWMIKKRKCLVCRNFFKGFLVITALYCCKGIRVIYQMQITKIHVQHVVCMLIRKTKWQQNHLNGSREIYFFLTNILTQHCSLNSGNWPCFSRSVNWNLWRLPQRPRLQECHDSPLTEQNRVFNLSQINTTDTHNDYIYH